MMKNLKLYNNKCEEINDFLFNNNIYIFIADMDLKTKVYQDIFKDDNEINRIYIINRGLGYKRIKVTVESLIEFFLSDYRPPYKYYYLDKRKALEPIYLSKIANIKLRNIDKNISNILSLNFYLKIKSIINKYNIELIKSQYKVVNYRDKTGIANYNYKIEMNEYIHLAHLKEMLIIFYKEVDDSIDINLFPTNENILMKYIKNYYDKYVILDYDNIETKKLLLDYYKNDFQAEDMVIDFVKKLFYIYKLVSKTTSLFVSTYGTELRQLIFLTGETRHSIKCMKTFYKYFDELMKDKLNYNNMMFIMELLETGSRKSKKLEIVNYLSVIELILVKGSKKGLSNQFQKKCLKCLNEKNIKDYKDEELKIIYDYRSKTIHGEYYELLKKINEISKLEHYKLNKMDKFELFYSNNEQLIEEKIEKRLKYVLRLILKLYIMNNKYTREIKNS